MQRSGARVSKEVAGFADYVVSLQSWAALASVVFAATLMIQAFSKGLPLLLQIQKFGECELWVRAA